MAKANSPSRISVGFALMWVMAAVPAFAAGTADGFNPNANGMVYAVAVQPDGKVLIGGDFTLLGVTGRNRMARLNSDGTVDISFNPDVNGTVDAIVVQPDGKIVIGGGFGLVGGVTRQGLARLNVDGSLDPGFSRNANGYVYCIALEPDGQIFVGGSFTTLGGVGINRIARLNPDGSLDGGFNPNVNAGSVFSIALEEDAQVVFGGDFGQVGGVGRLRIARVNWNGALDTGFDPGAGANDVVYSVAVQTDHKILVGGAFTTMRGAARNRIARLDSGGGLDSLDPNANGPVDSVILQADGKILLSGQFGQVGGAGRGRVARLNADGTLDGAFNPNADGDVLGLALQADGKVLLAGAFTAIGGAARNRIARVDNDAATQSLTVPNYTQVQWLRGGASPEARYVSFEASTDGGVTYTDLGPGTRISGGWERTSLGLPASGQLRARASTAGAEFGGSGGLVEAVTPFSGLAAPDITVSGNGVVIIDGDSTPSTADHTDFGTAPIAGTPVVRTFTVANVGTASLSLGSVVVSGPQASDFSVTAQPAATVAPAFSTTFQVTYTPSAVGLRSATLTFSTNDFDESPFNFAIQGTATASANANLSGLAVTSYSGPVLTTPGFASYNLSYWAAGSFNSCCVRVTPTTANINATIQVRVNGGGYQNVDSGSQSSDLPLNTGTNIVEVLVTAQAGNTQTYTLTANRSSDNPGNGGSFGAPDEIVRAIALQADGKILIGGDFSSAGGLARAYLARLNPDGTADAAFAPQVDGAVYGIVVQPDGKILLGGGFTTVSGASRDRVARLNPDGSLDPGFANPLVSFWVYAVARQVDGKILIGGAFTSVGGVTRNRVARLNADGTLDTGFDPNASDTVYTLATQADGKVLLGGDFTFVAGGVRSRLARLLADGSLDAAFTANLSGVAYAVVVQPDEKILIAGNFDDVNGGGCPKATRLNSDGTWDSFCPSINQGPVRSIALQADGKVLLGLEDFLFSSTSLKRFLVDGQTDSSFSSAVDGTVYSVAQQSDGKVLAGGDGLFSHLVRLESDAATQGLSATSFSRVEWLRGGSSPEIREVTFERSTDGGTTWSALGAGTRISGGWEQTGLSLPGMVSVRARGLTVGGGYSASTGQIETVMSLNGLPVPEIAVSGNGVDIADGDITPTAVDHTDFGSVNIAATLVRTFTITNTGTANLTFGSVSVSGAHAADFTVTAQPVSPLAPGGGTTFQVTFDPSAVGVRTAALSFTNNDADENPFNFSIQGTGVISSNADLVALSLSSGALAPSFAPGTTSYTATVAFAVTGLTVTPTRADSYAAIQVRVNGGNYASVASGSASGLLALNPGPNPVDIRLTAQDGTLKTYTVTVTRIPPVPGDVDPGFDPNANAYLYGVAVQPDGKILLSGGFTTIGGVTRNHIARLNPDGTLDAAFNLNVNGDISSLLVQPDGKIVIAGGFTQVGGLTRNGVARLNPDGTADAFNPNANAYLYAVAIQPDGKILLAGTFTTIGGVARNRVARMNVDGTLDLGFDPDASDWVYSLVVQADGKIVLGGSFTTMKGSPRNRVARVNADGTLDTFNPNADAAVLSVAQQADGKILIGGDFATLGGGTARNRIARLNADGSVDSFNPGADNSVYSLALQADGKILLAGFLTQTAGAGRNRIARLNADGSVDASFNPDANNWVLGAALQADGKILLGGTFTTVGGLTRNRVARLENDAATQSLTVPNATRVEWLRGGSSPESQQVTFELSTDGGTTYSLLGAGTRIAGGWERTGLSLPSSGKLRARARTSGGELSASNGLVETTLSFNISSNADLSALTLSAGSLTPGFSPATTTYAAGVGYYVTSLTVTPTRADPQATIQVRINGGSYQGVASGSPSASLILNVGANPIDVRVTAPDGTTIKTYTITVTRAAPVSGDVDTDFDPGAGGTVTTAAAQPDGKILFGGFFTTLGGASRNRIARVGADGTLDAGFNPNPDGNGLGSIAVQPDGKILLGGDFGTVDGAGNHAFMARVNGNGTIDVGFTARTDGVVYSTTLLTDGRIVFGGSFSTLFRVGQGVFTRKRVLRVGPDSALDPGFDPVADLGWVYSTAAQVDGKIVLGGSFQTVGGVARNRVARILADGTLDASFNPDANQAVNVVAIQADGKVLLGGDFTTMGGVTRNRIARVLADGTLDSGFNPNLNESVYSLALQADGKILVGGYFTTVGGVARNRIARLNPDGTLDSGFNPDANGLVHAVALQADGKIVVAGQFDTIGPLPRARIARLENQSATQSLTVPSINRVQWLRGGSSPETQAVTFELSVDDGATYSALGTGTRISGGWERTGLSLPPSGRIRARALTSGGSGGGSGGLMETVTLFSGLPVPEIVVSGNGINIADGDGTPSVADFTDFGSANTAGITVVRTFTVSNSGTASLTLGSVLVSGTHAADFTVTAQPPSSVAAGNSTTFQVTFDPSAAGLRSATLSFANSDSDENPFDFAIQGTGVSLAPTIGDVTDQTVAEDGVKGPITVTISDTETPAASLVLTGTSSNAALVPNGNLVFGGSGGSRNLTLTPLPNANGTTTITLTVTDGSALTATDTFVLTVTAENDLPVFTIGGNRTHPFGTTAAQTFTDGATGISDGDPEVTQALSFDVQTSTAPVAPLDGLSNASVFETGAQTPLPTLGWTNVTGTAQVWDLVSNGVLLGTTAYGNYQVQHATATPILRDSTYRLHVQMGFVAGLAGGSANYTLELGTLNGSTFTPLGSQSGTVNYQGNLSGGAVSGTADVVVSTGAVVTGDPLAVRWAQTGTAGTSDYFGLDGVTLSVAPNLFTIPPALASDGTLTYTPNGAPGTVTLNVRLTDDAAAGGAALTTATQTFTISVTNTSPTVSAPASALITTTSATLGGNVTWDGGSAITERGVVYAQTATNNDPLIGGTGVAKASVAGTTGVFTTGVTSLTPASGYSFKAYAINAVGASYTSVATFTTGANAPTVTTPTSSLITGTTATLGGSVISDGGATITERGVVYSQTATNNDPLVGGTGVTTVPVIGETGLFAAGITGLAPTTGHSFRAFATNAVGTAYTSVATFTTTCPSITLSSLPNGNVTVDYAGSVTASGGTGPYTYAVTSGTLPPGLTLTASGAGAGNVTGTPTTAGTYPFDLTATDTSGAGTCTGTQSYSVVIGAEPGRDFFTLTPCRILDTRNPVGALGGPALAALTDRTFPVAGTCGIPADAKAISLNIAVTGSTNPGNIRLHAGGTAAPLVSAINFKVSQTRSNNAVIPLSALGELAAYLDQAAGTAHLILDVNGYFK